MQFVKLNDVYKFGVTTHNPSGGALKNTDETPRWSVFENDSDTAILEGNFTSRTGFIGTYKGSFHTSGVNGFNSNGYYEVHASGKIDGIVGRAIISNFVVDDIVNADVVMVSGDRTVANNLRFQYDGVTGLAGDTFPATQAQIGDIAIGSAGISTVAESFTKAGAEPETNTYTSTHENDTTYHIVEDDGGSIDAYYQFDIGPNGVPVEFEWFGYAQGNNSTINIFAYNYGTTSYEQIGTITGTAGTTRQSLVFSMTIQHVGTGANDGKVRFRFTSADATAVATDYLLATYTVINQALGYELGAVWVDTDNGSSTGTTPGTDGLVTNRSTLFENAKTIATALKYRSIYPTNGNTIVFNSDLNNFIIGKAGSNWNVALNNQNLVSTNINDASVSGVATGNDIHLYRCEIYNTTLPPLRAYNCGLDGDIVANSGGDYLFVDCYSNIAGTGTPSFDFGSGTYGPPNLNLRNYSGGILLKNMASGSNCSIEGNGQVKIGSNCTGGTIAIRGNFRIIDQAAGAVEIIPTVPTINQIDQGKVQSATSNTVTLATTASAVNGQYDPGEILIVTGTGAGQSRGIIDYNGTTKVAIIDKDWRTNPDSTSSYIVFTSAGKNHVNEGQAQGGGASTITLNTAATATDDIYKGQTVFLVGGTGQDQSRVITAYNGTSKVATVHRAWDTAPDSTTSYIMLPLPALGDSIVNIETATASVYYADVKYIKDVGNSADEYSVRWFKDSVPVASGDLTNPAISVFRTSNGASVFSNQTMDYISPALGTVKYNTGLLTASGEAFIVSVSGTIDSATRTWEKIVGLDDIF